MPRDTCAAKCGCVALLLLQVMGCTPAPHPEPGPPARASRPNILLAISDDQSWLHAGAYGDRGVDTPTFDRIARQGVLFNNAFAASPGCSPSRAALLTGRHTWQNEEAGTHASSFPKQLLTYPDLLEQAGYAVGFTGKGWGPGNWEISGRARNPAGPEFNERELEVPHDGIGLQDYAANFEDFLDSVPESGPFAFWYGGHEPHRIYENGVGLKVGKELSDAQVPPFLPDNDQIRSDILDYYVEIEWFDTQLKRMLDLLGERDLLHNTLVLVTSDNGMPFPRAKANGYEYGIHVPLAVAWPARVPGDRVVDDLVGFVDLAPTLLEVAGIETPTAMVGRSLLDILLSSADGLVDATRDRVFAARERHSYSRYDNWTYPIRAMRTRDFLYIRNFEPDRWPAGHPTGFEGDKFGYYDIDAAPSKSALIEGAGDPAVAEFFRLAVELRPEEELFDVRRDPGNLVNLVDDPAFTDIKERLAKELNETLRSTGDPRMTGGAEIWESYERYSGPMRSFPPPEL